MKYNEACWRKIANRLFYIRLYKLETTLQLHS